MPSNFYGCFRHELCGNKDCSKIVKFLARTTSHGHRSGDFDDVQQRSRFAQKGQNWWRIMGVWLWHRNQSPIILMEAFRKAKTKQKKNTSSSGKFFDCNGVVYHEFLPQGRAVNRKYCLEVMLRLREAIRKKRTELWRNQSWILHHVNTTAHTSMLVREFLAKKNRNQASNIDYLPDWLFPLSKP